MTSRTLSIARNPVRDALPLMAVGLLGLGLMLALPLPAHGQVFGSTPYVAAPDPAVEALRNRVNQLESDLKAATDRAEKLGFDLAQIRRTAEDAKAGQQAAEQKYMDLLGRVERLEQGAPADIAAPTSARVGKNGEVTADAGAAAAVANVDIASLPQDEEGLFKAVRTLLLDNDYASAEAGLKAFLGKYPKSKNAHEAQYMLGDSLLYQKRYGEAVSAYEKLLNAYPNSSNGPNAVVKLARALTLMKKKTEACQVLDQLTKLYPKAPSSAKDMAKAERERASCK